MIVFGWQMRGIVLGAKLDECPECGHIGAHIIIRKTYWFSLFWLAVVPLWVSHGLLCPICGMWAALPYREIRIALREGVIDVQRDRPQLREAALGHIPTNPADWTALGLEPGASAEQVQAAYRRKAKVSHPDTGGSERAFSDLQGAYRRVSQTFEQSGNAVDEHELSRVLRRVEVNPKRGFFDVYLKAWPILATVVIIAALVSSAQSASASEPQMPRGNQGAPHTCWISNDSINGCRMSSGTIIGSTNGTATTCYFYEPLRDNQTVPCD